MQTDVKKGMKNLENNVNNYKKPKSQLMIEQRDGHAKKYIEQLIIEMEMQQLAESIVSIKGRVSATEQKQKKASPSKMSTLTYIQD